ERPHTTNPDPPTFTPEELLWESEDIPQRPAPPTNPPQLYGAWEVIKDPAAPPYGFVLANGNLRVWAAGYDSIPIGEPSDPAVLDFFDPTIQIHSEAVARAQYEFSIAPIPTHDCQLPDPPAESDHAEFQRVATEYVDCVVDAWRPLATSLGVTLKDTYPVRHCIMPEYQIDEFCPAENNPGSAWWNAAEESIYFAPDYPWNQWADKRSIASTLIHEAMHLLQFQVAVDGQYLLFPTIGYLALEHDENSRRLETQAECLATGMEARPGMRRADFWDHSLFFPGDERHHGHIIGDYWSRRAIQGHVGDCMTWLAQPHLNEWR
ncbi:MAG: hypothetical protein Q4G64_06725, partial [bacterium]|nr:hypothetical protein [bacterium]